MAATCQLISTHFTVLIVEQRLLCVEKVPRSTLQAVQLLVLHLVEVLEIDLAPASQLQRLKDLEVQELELVVGDQRRLAHVEDLLARLVDHRLRQTHESAAEYLGPLT